MKNIMKIIGTFLGLAGILLLYEIITTVVIFTVMHGHRLPLWTNWIGYAVYLATVVIAACIGRGWSRRMTIGLKENITMGVITLASLIFAIYPLDTGAFEPSIYVIMNIITIDFGLFIIAAVLMLPSNWGYIKNIEKGKRKEK